MRNYSRQMFVGVVVLSLGVVAGVGIEQSAPPLEIHTRHFFWGYPLGAPRANDLVIRDIYALSSNDETKFADWVAYQLDRQTVGERYNTYRRWMADPFLDDNETLEPEDYRGAHKTLGTDRGHQASLGSFAGSPYFWQTNYLSNITPQKSALNRGPWMRLEHALREFVSEQQKPVWVVTGPYYRDGGMCPNDQVFMCLPDADEPHRIPSGYWKIIATGNRYDPVSVNVSAFLFAQGTPREVSFEIGLTSVDEIEEYSGLDVLWDLPDATERVLEAAITTWPPIK